MLEPAEELPDEPLSDDEPLDDEPDESDDPLDDELLSDDELDEPLSEVDAAAGVVDEREPRASLA